ncbi:MAG: transcriptional regulator [Peptococcaceae bacterium BICA1-7]|nr:MAG: transcriptional regulator [Peptococcaceae bacterium BICA1-7]HBV97211.1 helix-turn-helix domain-containing protein [Desulfotomaculum sp.]
MNFIRIGDKVLNAERIHRTVDEILRLRQEGMSQQEVADRLGVDRTLVSRLESLGEIRKGPQVALIGFPVANARELTDVARAGGVDFILLMNEKERWSFVEEKNGADLINHFMSLISQVKSYDTVIFIGSDMRIKLVEAILGPKVISWEIGISPLKEDRWVNPDQLRQLVVQLKNAG